MNHVLIQRYHIEKLPLRESQENATHYLIKSAKLSVWLSWWCFGDHIQWLFRKTWVQIPLAAIGHFGKYHNTLCLSPQILHKHCLCILLGPFLSPKRNWKQSLCKIWGDNEEYYGFFPKWPITVFPQTLLSVAFLLTFSQFLLNLDYEAIWDPPGGDGVVGSRDLLTIYFYIFFCQEKLYLQPKENYLQTVLQWYLRSTNTIGDGKQLVTFTP